MLTLKLWWIKFKLALSVFISKIIYNLHKPIPGIAVNRNIKYAKHKGLHHRLDVYYQTNSKKLLRAFKRLNKNLVEICCTSKNDPIWNKKPCIVYIHGGGWSTLDKSLYETLCKRLASFGFVVFNCNYGLAPKNSLEGIIDDTLKAISFARLIAPHYGGDFSKIILAGDSSGAHIVSLIAGMNDAGKLDEYELNDSIKALILMYGVYDLYTLEGTGHRDIKEYIHSILHKNYANASEFFEKFSTKNYVTKKFPPSIILSGEIDKLHDTQSKTFSELLTKNNVFNNTYFVPKTSFKGFHGFMSIDGLQTNEEGLKAIKEFLEQIEDIKC